MRSSSNRSGGVCDAIVVQDQRKVGPLRLPENRADDFIDHFNRTYAEVGMKLDPQLPSSRDEPDHTPDGAGDGLPADNCNSVDAEVGNKKIPGSENAAGDRDSG